MYKNMKEKLYFILHLMIHSTVQSRGALEGTLEAAPNDALTNLHKDAQEGALEVALGQHQWLHLSMQSLIFKFEKKNGSFIGGPDAALEGALYGGLNVTLEGEPQSSP